MLILLIDNRADSRLDEKEIEFFEFLKLDFCKAVVEFLLEIQQIDVSQDTVIKSIENLCFEQAESSFFVSENKEFLDSLTRLYLKIYEKASVFSELNSTGCKNFGLELNFGKEGLKIILQFSKADFSKAKVLVEKFNQALPEIQDDKIKKVYTNTKLFFHQGKILIVTHLPRACIENLRKQQ